MPPDWYTPPTMPGSPGPLPRAKPAEVQAAEIIASAIDRLTEAIREISYGGRR